MCSEIEKRLSSISDQLEKRRCGGLLVINYEYIGPGDNHWKRRTRLYPVNTRLMKINIEATEGSYKLWRSTKNSEELLGTFTEEREVIAAFLMAVRAQT